MTSKAKFTVRRFMASERILDKDFDDFDEAKADYERAHDQDRVVRCELIDNRIGQVAREWVLSPPDDI